MKYKFVSHILVVFINTIWYDLSFSLGCVNDQEAYTWHPFLSQRSTLVLSLGTHVSQGFSQADSKSKNKEAFQEYNTIQLEGKFVIHLEQSPAQSSGNF